MWIPCESNNSDLHLSEALSAENLADASGNSWQFFKFLRGVGGFLSSTLGNLESASCLDRDQRKWWPLP